MTSHISKNFSAKCLMHDHPKFTDIHSKPRKDIIRKLSHHTFKPQKYKLVYRIYSAENFNKNVKTRFNIFNV